MHCFEDKDDRMQLQRDVFQQLVHKQAKENIEKVLFDVIACLSLSQRDFFSAYTCDRELLMSICNCKITQRKLLMNFYQLSFERSC